jgi:hypothetical protein
MWAGIALQAGGNVAQGIGNAQAGRAVENAWRNFRDQQDGFDNQAHQRTLSFLDALSPDVLAGTARTNEVAQRLHGSSQAVGKAIQAKAAKGGRHALPPGGQQALADLLRTQQGMDAIEARGGGFAAGLQDIHNLARGFQGDRARIARDADLWAGLLPYALRTAGHEGGAWRGVGQGMQIAGAGLTNWAMSQPANGTAPTNELASTPGVAGVQPAAPSWQQPAQWQMGQSMVPNYLDLWGR